MRFTVFCCAVVSIPWNIFAAQPVLPMAAIAVAVVDANNRPVTNCQVVAIINGAYGQPITDSSVTMRATPDARGIARFTNRPSASVQVVVKGAGYYMTHSESLFLPSIENGGLLPWHRTNTLVLKAMVNPIPMYAIFLPWTWPETEKAIGFDLVEGDWTKPFGKGFNADLFFRREFIKRAPKGRGSAITDGEDRYFITFPNRGDGLVPFTAPEYPRGSELRSAYEAPADGYQAEWTTYRVWSPGKPFESNHDVKRNFYIRVRTVMDEEGRITSANYGKIYGELPNCICYFNPEVNSRNVEFAPDKNLTRKSSSRFPIRWLSTFP